MGCLIAIAGPMSSMNEDLALSAFQNAAARVPAYRTLLAEAGIDASNIQSVDGFRSLPTLGKGNTFQRFPIHELCVDGEIGRLSSVLTSSGHSGIFAFGLNAADVASEQVEWIDSMLDAVFQVRSKPTLLINCLPMGVKVPSHACTVAETSVRPDMVIGLVGAFARYYSQIILLGEAAFVKATLEMGEAGGIVWPDHLVHVILGEELLAENARKYLSFLLGGGNGVPGQGLVCSSMGVGEVGLNLFGEVPPSGLLIALRQALHENEALRQAVFGNAATVPSIFAYDPQRVFVEFDPEGRLILTTLDERLRLPLIRYSTGDCGRFLDIPETVRPELEKLGFPVAMLSQIPLVAIFGRGHHVATSAGKVAPEEIKEGLYLDPALARMTTANFRLKAVHGTAQVRVQLSQGVALEEGMNARYASAISRYVKAPFEVVCEPYASFGSGMALDYERKFDYLGS